MASKPTPAPLAPVQRTSAGLRAALFDELDALRNGTGNSNRANAVAKLADQVIGTVKMELEVHRHLAKTIVPQGDVPPSIGAPIALS